MVSQWFKWPGMVFFGMCTIVMIQYNLVWYGCSVVMVWLQCGYGVVVVWLWCGYSVVMVWLQCSYGVVTV